MSSQVTLVSTPGSATVTVGDSSAVTLASTSSAAITVTNLTTSSITGAASTVVSADLTASRAVEANASGKLVASGITTTELGHLDGVSSNLQTQLNAKAASIHAHTINGLSDVNTSGVATGKVLSYSGSGWVPTVITVPGLWGEQPESTSVKLFEDFLGNQITSSNWYAMKTAGSASVTNPHLKAEDEAFGAIKLSSGGTAEGDYAVMSTSGVSKKAPANGETTIFEALFKVDNTGSTGEMILSVGGFNANDNWEDKWFGFLETGSVSVDAYRVVVGYVTSDANWRCAAGNSSSLASATATVTITDFTKLNTGDKVNLIATDTTNYNFVNGDQSSVAGTWESTTSQIATATNLMNVINTSSGPAGTRFTATVAESTVNSVGTVTITTVANINNGDKVNLIATDTTSHDFTAGDVAGGGTWIAEVDNNTSATNLATQINANSKFSASADGAVVTITQSVADVDGNTAITLTDSFAAGMSKTDFTGGYAYGVVTITQATAGAAGNTIVTLTDPLDGMSHTNFTGASGISTGVTLVNDTYTRLAIKCVFNSSTSRWDATVYVNGTVVSGTSFTIQPTITSPANNYQLCAQIGNRATNKDMHVDWMMATYTRDAIGYVT